MTTLRCATWNLRVHRDRGVVIDEVLGLLDEYDLDLLTVCEAGGYVRSLRRALKREGYRVVFVNADDSARDSAVIVRRGLRVRFRRLHRLEHFGWERGEGRPGLHDPRSAVSVNVEGIRVLAIHMPPGPFEGERWQRRRLANETSFDTVARLVGRWNKRRRPWVAHGDWNRRPDDPTVRAFLKESGAEAQGGGIDWIASRGVKVPRVRRINYGGSDHEPRLFTISR